MIVFLCACSQHGSQLPLLPAPGAPRPRITTGAQQLHAGGPQGVPLGTYLPAGQSVFAQVASSLQQPAGQPGAASGQQPGQATASAAAPPPPPQVWQPPSALGLPPLKRLIGKELRILDLDEKQRRKFLRVRRSVLTPCCDAASDANCLASHCNARRRRQHQLYKMTLAVGFLLR